MGLGFSHGAAHWSYSGFHAFRQRLARECGINLMAMEGFGGGTPWPKKMKYGLQTLLSHSDCDGKIGPRKCAKLAPRLRKAVAKWPDDDYDKQSALELAAGMEEAAELGEFLRFC